MATPVGDLVTKYLNYVVDHEGESAKLCMKAVDGMADEYMADALSSAKNAKFHLEHMLAVRERLAEVLSQVDSFILSTREYAKGTKTKIPQ